MVESDSDATQPGGSTAATAGAASAVDKSATDEPLTGKAAAGRSKAGKSADAGAGASGKAAAGAAKVKPRSARRRSRELAVQGLYQWLVAGVDSGAIEAHLHEADGFEKADLEHFKHLLHGSVREIEALHAVIAPHVDRKLEELSPVEHATLLVGSYELLHHAEIPYRVIINEAVELAKTFGGTDGYKYVNGVLDRVAAKLRPHG